MFVRNNVFIYAFNVTFTFLFMYIYIFNSWRWLRIFGIIIETLERKIFSNFSTLYQNSISCQEHALEIFSQRLSVHERPFLKFLKFEKFVYKLYTNYIMNNYFYLLFYFLTFVDEKYDATGLIGGPSFHRRYVCSIPRLWLKYPWLRSHNHWYIFSFVFFLFLHDPPIADYIVMCSLYCKMIFDSIFFSILLPSFSIFSLVFFQFFEFMS